jgi:hypothetical protein
MTKYNGEVKVKLGGKDYTIVYNWAALADIQEKHGFNLLLNLANAKIDAVADVLLVGLKKHHPDVTKEFLLEASPPLIPLLTALNEAVTYCFYGADGAPKEAGEEGKK